MIDLPELSQSEVQKESHKDFYAGQKDDLNKDQQSKEGDASALTDTLIQNKFKKIDSILKERDEQRNSYLRLSDQPASKWQAIYALEQIKERNKPMLPKEDVPKVPFFLFDINKVTEEDPGEGAARDFLAETFFSAFK